MIVLNHCHTHSHLFPKQSGTLDQGQISHSKALLVVQVTVWLSDAKARDISLFQHLAFLRFEVCYRQFRCQSGVNFALESRSSNLPGSVD